MTGLPVQQREFFLPPEFSSAKRLLPATSAGAIQSATSSAPSSSSSSSSSSSPLPHCRRSLPCCLQVCLLPGKVSNWCQCPPRFSLSLYLSLFVKCGVYSAKWRTKSSLSLPTVWWIAFSRKMMRLSRASRCGMVVFIWGDVIWAIKNGAGPMTHSVCVCERQHHAWRWR